MKIIDVLNLSKVKDISVIAKEDLNIDEKTLVLALKKAGCVLHNDNRGWDFTGGEEALQMCIEDFLESNGKLVVEDVVRKRATFHLDVELLKKLKVQAAVEERNIYELVEQAVKQYLAKK